MCRRVPEGLLTLVAVELVQLQIAVALERPPEVPQLKGLAEAGGVLTVWTSRDLDDALVGALDAARVAHARDAARLSKALGDSSRHVER